MRNGRRVPGGPRESGAGRACETQGRYPGDSRTARAVGEGEKDVRETGGRGRAAGRGRGNLGAKKGEGDPEEQGPEVVGGNERVRG